MKDFLLDYFKDIDSFIDLQHDFQKQDYHYDMNPEFNPGFEKGLIKEEFSINNRVYAPYEEDPYNTSFTIEKFYFYKDFLPRTISQISSNFLQDFYSYIREDLLEDQKERRKFLNEQKKSVSKIFENINQFDFIGFSLFNELQAQIIEIEKAVHSPTLYNDKYLKADKLSLIGWKEQDLLMFFNFLRKEKVISPSVTDVDLGLFLERNFCVEKDDEVTSLENLNKKLHDFTSGIKKTYKTEVRLKRLFNKL